MGRKIAVKNGFFEESVRIEENGWRCEKNKMSRRWKMRT